MNGKTPIKYDHIEPLTFGGNLPDAATFESAKAVILPIPLESTTSYMTGTRNGPREILIASTHMELWDEETNTDIHSVGIYTLPEMELPFDDMADMMAEIRRVTAAILEHDKFPVILGGEHSITSPVVAAMET
jgi:agmatinase